MPTQPVGSPPPDSTTRLDFLIAVDKLLDMAEQARRLRDCLLGKPKPEEASSDE